MECKNISPFHYVTQEITQSSPIQSDTVISDIVNSTTYVPWDKHCKKLHLYTKDDV